MERQNPGKVRFATQKRRGQRTPRRGESGARRKSSRADEKLSDRGKHGVANGTRTRNSQNHNLGLYH